VQEMAGTAYYMAPEQLQGKPRRASDQYSLAIVVYEWLTGECPFNGSFIEIASQHMLVPPPPLRDKIPGIPREIEEVVLAALAKDPERRFGSVHAFATAFEQAVRSLDAETMPLAPRSEAINPQSQSYSTRYMITPPDQAALARDANAPPAVGQNVSPTMGNTPAPQTQYAAGPYVNTPQTLLSGPQYGQFVHTPVHTPETGSSQRGISRRTVVLGLAGIAGLSTCSGALALSGALPKALHALGFFSDPTATPSIPRGTILATYHSSQWIWTLAWSPDGKYIASSGNDPTVQIWDAKTGHLVSTYRGHVDKLAPGSTVSVIALDWSPDGKYIVSVGDVQNPTGFMPDVQVWEVATNKLISTYTGHNPRPGHENIVSDVAWSPDNTRIVSAGAYDKTAQVWDAHTGQNILTYRGHAYDVWKVRWSPNGRSIASASGDPGTPSNGGDVQVWDTHGNHIATYSGQNVEVLDVAWSPDSQYIASTDRNGGIQVWKALTGNAVTSYNGSQAVSWSPDGKFIATLIYSSGSNPGIPTILILGALTGNQVYAFHGHSQQVNAIKWSSDSTRIASGGADKAVRVWQAE
jgi:eukaryotic-like serine/threonine-protein kinase